MSISTTAFTKIFIGTSAVITRTSDETALASYEADAWKEIGEVENIGEFGDEAAAIEVSTLGEARKRRLKGTRDAGTLELTCLRNASDAGQTALIAARDGKDDVNFKVELNDAPTGGTPSIFYFTGAVLSGRVAVSGPDETVKITASIGINSDVLEDGAAA